MILREADYRGWLSAQSRWSNKAQSDLVSRLKRADTMAPLSAHQTTAEYERALTNSPNWSSIPRSSQTSILASVRLYIRWLASR
jgi:hypothetical protein